MTRTPNAFRSISRTAALALVLLGGSVRAQEPAPSSIESLLADARRKYDEVDHTGAVAALDRAIPLMQARRGDRTVQPLLVAAYLLRARTYFVLRDFAKSQADMEALLRVDPAYRMPGDVSARVTALFEDTRKTVVGEIVLTVTPQNADVDVDGVPLTGPERALSLASGPHTIAARRSGYRPDSREITVTAGTSQPLEITLERTSASLSFVTIPAGVEVSVDGTPRGATVEAGRTQQDQDIAARFKLPPDKAWGRMTLTDLTVGQHLLEFNKSCFVAAKNTVPIDRFTDYSTEPIILKPATGTLKITSAGGDAMVYVDDQQRGNAPMTLTECEGTRTIEVRSQRYGGRFVRRVTIRPGDQQTIEAQPKPAFALLSVSGLPEGLRGAEDLRVKVEQALISTTGVTVFAPPPDRAQKALQDEKLEPGWLAFDRSGREMGKAAENITPAARRDLSARLSQKMEAQGIAAVSVNSTDRSNVFVSLLASGSAEPDVIAFTPDSPESAARAVDALDVGVELYTPSIGLLAIDVIDLAGAVVARVERSGGAAAAGLAAGDVIVGANGTSLANAQALADVIRNLAAGATLSLDVRPRGATPPRKVELRPVLVPRALAMADKTMRFNPILLHLRRLLASQPGNDEQVLRLNIGIALMRLGNWQDARPELERVSLPPGGGVSDGTVQYLRGLCYEALGLFADAEKAWTTAKGSDALLTADGPPVKDLAAGKLASIARSRAGGSR
jgi:tetratricopeptide (TPR) repeat protein